MTNIEVGDLREGYIEVAEAILAEGKEVSPRGLKTREILNATIRVEDSLDVLPLGINRKNLSLEIAAAEALQLIGGFADPDMMTSISRKGFERFLSGGVFHGSYGPRIRQGVRAAFQSLLSDPDSRQAVVPIFRTEDAIEASAADNPPDIPCTKDLHFMIRDGKLVCVASMRSNDFWKGLSYDAFQFTQLQASLAFALDVEPGPYFHHADSLHIYETDLLLIEELRPLPRSLELLVIPRGVEGWDVADFQRRAVDLWALREEPATVSERWYLETLRPHVRASRHETVEHLRSSHCPWAVNPDTELGDSVMAAAYHMHKQMYPTMVSHELTDGGAQGVIEGYLHEAVR